MAIVINGGNNILPSDTFQEWLDVTNEIVQAFDDVVDKDNNGNVIISGNLSVANTITTDSIKPSVTGGTITVAGDISMDDTLTIDANGEGQVVFQLASSDTWKIRTNVTHSELQFFDGTDTLSLIRTTNRIDSATFKISGNILKGGTGVTYTEATGTFSIGQDVGTTADVTFNSVTTNDLTVNGELDASAASTITFPTGFGLVPTGAILMWSGSIASIPTGWALCDGTNGTPNLQDRFIVGAGNTYAVDATGGADSVTLTTNQMPAHTHGAGTLTTSSAGTHYHTYQATNGATVQINLDDDGGGSNSGLDNNSSGGGISTRTNDAGAHTHTITGSTGSVGGGQSHENRPPYYALAYIMKT